MKSPKPATDNSLNEHFALWQILSLIFCGIVVAILKMETGRNFAMSETILDIIIYQHMKFRWNRTMLNLCGIVAAILKMAIGRNFSMSAINSGHHNLPKYEISLKSDNVEFYLSNRLKWNYLVLYVMCL